MSQMSDQMQDGNTCGGGACFFEVRYDSYPKQHPTHKDRDLLHTCTRYEKQQTFILYGDQNERKISIGSTTPPALAKIVWHEC